VGPGLSRRRRRCRERECGGLSSSPADYILWSEERRKLPQRGLERSASRKRFWGVSCVPRSRSRSSRPTPHIIDFKGAITSKIKHAIKHKTSPARLAQLFAQLLQPSLAFCFSLQPMTAYRPGLDSTPLLTAS